MATKTGFRYWLIAFALCVVAVFICFKYVDRQTVDFVQANIAGTKAYSWLQRSLSPLIAVVVAALAFLLAIGCWAISGRRLSSWTATPLLCSWAAMWGLGAVTILKRFFGRTSTYLPFTPDRFYGFHLMSGGPDLESFPSGTTTVAASIIAVLWILFPRLRVVWAIILAYIAVAVVLTNNHFVADAIAGCFLGASIGWMTVRLMSRE